MKYNTELLKTINFTTENISLVNVKVVAVKCIKNTYQKYNILLVSARVVTFILKY